jgi:hypothetical protein
MKKEDIVVKTELIGSTIRRKYYYKDVLFFDFYISNTEYIGSGVIGVGNIGRRLIQTSGIQSSIRMFLVRTTCKKTKEILKELSHSAVLSQLEETVYPLEEVINFFQEQKRAVALFYITILSGGEEFFYEYINNKETPFQTWINTNTDNELGFFCKVINKDQPIYTEKSEKRTRFSREFMDCCGTMIQKSNNVESLLHTKKDQKDYIYKIQSRGRKNVSEHDSTILQGVFSAEPKIKVPKEVNEFVADLGNAKRHLFYTFS